MPTYGGRRYKAALPPYALAAILRQPQTTDRCARSPRPWIATLSLAMTAQVGRMSRLLFAGVIRRMPTYGGRRDKAAFPPYAPNPAGNFIAPSYRHCVSRYPEPTSGLEFIFVDK
jgi:hypothetical protein